MVKLLHKNLIDINVQVFNLTGAKQAIAISGFLCLAAANTAFAEEKFVDVQLKATPWSQGWSVGVHVGRVIDKSVRTLGAFNPFTVGFDNYGLISLGVRKKLADYGPYFSLYSELNISRIFGDEDYSEVFFTPTVSWNYFPWDNIVDTSASIGVGLSYTSIESNLDNSGTNLLASMIFELEFELPKYEKVSLFTRIHHRSTAGIFADSGGSNFYAVGLRYNFN